MDLSNNLILVIVVTSIATFASRFLGILTAENISDKSKLFDWFNYVAYSILAALITRMIIFPAGALLDSTLLIRLAVLSISIAIFLYSKKNLVLPTILSFILLTFLEGIK
jgi:branched-subunit amino acid transport protein|tara:strand:- start:992 stop:1321 length:330 start_codon:yes stop_codon:yes gene_type:complete